MATERSHNPFDNHSNPATIRLKHSKLETQLTDEFDIFWSGATSWARNTVTSFRTEDTTKRLLEDFRRRGANGGNNARRMYEKRSKVARDRRTNSRKEQLKIDDELTYQKRWKCESIPYIVNPWKGMTPLGGKIIVFSVLLCLPLITTCIKPGWVERSFKTSPSREKHNSTWYNTSSNTKYWSSLDAVRLISLIINLSIIKSYWRTLSFRDSKYE